jgi:acetyl-CoA acetyltransferase
MSFEIISHLVRRCGISIVAGFPAFALIETLVCPHFTQHSPKMTSPKVYVIGVGLTQFLKPRGKVSYTELGLQASVKALIDANLTYDAIEQAYCGYIYGESTCGQRVLYQLGMTQIPIVNVNNNCATGSTALWMGRNAIRGGADCVLCVGWEEMEPGIFSVRRAVVNGFRTFEE